MKKFLVALLGAFYDVLIENIYLFVGLYFAHLVLRSFTGVPLGTNIFWAVLMLFLWLSDRIKLERERLRKDLDEEILRNYNRTEDRAIARSYALLAEIRKSRE